MLIECLRRLRDARATILRDSEAFHESVIALEHVGQVLAGRTGGGLDNYRREILDLVVDHDESIGRNARRLFDLVRRARNDVAHEGAWARNHNTLLVELLILIEDGIRKRMGYVRDVMVQGPTIAETWHLIAHVRKSILANSFSFIPVRHQHQWKLISDAELLRFLGSPGAINRKHRLNETIISASSPNETGRNPLKLTDAVCLHPDVSLEDAVTIMHADQPILITDSGSPTGQLLGILAPFDIL